VRSALIATQKTILLEGDFLVGTKIIVDNDVLEQMCHVSCPGSDVTYTLDSALMSAVTTIEHAVPFEEYWIGIRRKVAVEWAHIEG